MARRPKAGNTPEPRRITSPSPIFTQPKTDMKNTTSNEIETPTTPETPLGEDSVHGLFGWIPVSEQRPPLTAETPETDGFFLMLRHNPKRDAPGKYRMHLWFGSVPIDCTHWSRIPSLPNEQGRGHLPAAQGVANKEDVNVG